MKLRQPFAQLSLAVIVGAATGCTHFIVNDPNQGSTKIGSAPIENQAAGATMQAPLVVAPMQTMPTHRQRSAARSETTLLRTAATECEEGEGVFINDNGNKKESLKIRVSGYGAPPKAFYPEPQRRLMAMRAAKIDAYRNLAERVKGVQIWGGTTIGDMVVEKDRFRVYLDTHLSGARVISENPAEDGTFETTVELMVDQDFLSGTTIEKPKKEIASADPCAENQVPARAPSDSIMRRGNMMPAMMKTDNLEANRSSFYFEE